jgi:hypothetical protein
MDYKILLVIQYRSIVGLDFTAVKALAFLFIILITSCILAFWLSIRKPFNKNKGYLNPLNFNN